MNDDLRNYLTESETNDILKGIAFGITSVLPAGVLFALVLFDGPGVGQYISNANRQDVIKALRECADKLETHKDIPR